MRAIQELTQLKRSTSPRPSPPRRGRIIRHRLEIWRDWICPTLVGKSRHVRWIFLLHGGEIKDEGRKETASALAACDFGSDRSGKARKFRQRTLRAEPTMAAGKSAAARSLYQQALTNHSVESPAQLHAPEAMFNLRVYTTLQRRAPNRPRSSHREP